MFMQSSFSFQVISEIIESCRAHDYTDVLLVHEHRGVPDGLIVCHLPFGPTAYFGLHNVASISLTEFHIDFRGQYANLLFRTGYKA